MVADELDLLFGFLNDIRPKHLAFSYFKPVKRGTTLAAIQGFKEGHLQTSLIAIVVGEFGKWQAVLPLGPI
jgi:hypothetical protein